MKQNLQHLAKTAPFLVVPYQAFDAIGRVWSYYIPNKREEEKPVKTSTTSNLPAPRARVVFVPARDL